jgi:hypothetical protein
MQHTPLSASISAPASMANSLFSGSWSNTRGQGGRQGGSRCGGGAHQRARGPEGGVVKVWGKSSV